MLRLRKSKSCNSTCSTTFCSKATSPCAWLENLFVQKQAQTVDQSRSAQNAAAAIEQMVNTGAVSRGQFGQVAVPAVAEVAPVQSNNAYISQSPVKQDVREHVEKDDKSQQQRQNNKKRKHKEQREQHHQSHEQQHQVHEEVVQLSRQEQRELKRQQNVNSSKISNIKIMMYNTLKMLCHVVTVIINNVQTVQIATAIQVY